MAYIPTDPTSHTEKIRASVVAYAAAVEEALGIGYEAKDSPHTAPGWRFLGIEYTAIDDPAYPKDPAVTEALRRIDQGKGVLVPLWARWKFLSPRGQGTERVVVFGRHAIGRYINDPRSWRAPFPCEMPPNADFQAPNQLDRDLLGAPDPTASDLPGAYVPWDWRLVYEPHARMSAKDLKKKYIEDVIARREEAMRKAVEEEGYIRRQFQPFWDKLLGRVSEVELMEAERKRAYLRRQKVKILREQQQQILAKVRRPMVGYRTPRPLGWLR